MKKAGLVMLMAISCSLYVHPLFASIPTSPTKTCPDCKGRGYSQNWYGGQDMCENCGGDGKVFSWLNLGLMVGAIYISWNFWSGSKTKKANQDQ